MLPTRTATCGCRILAEQICVFVCLFGLHVVFNICGHIQLCLLVAGVLMSLFYDAATLKGHAMTPDPITLYEALYCVFKGLVWFNPV